MFGVNQYIYGPGQKGFSVDNFLPEQVCFLPVCFILWKGIWSLSIKAYVYYLEA